MSPALSPDRVVRPGSPPRRHRARLSARNAGVHRPHGWSVPQGAGASSRELSALNQGRAVELDKKGPNLRTSLVSDKGEET
jgi:hypothetical protein